MLVRWMRFESSQFMRNLLQLRGILWPIEWDFRSFAGMNWNVLRTVLLDLAVFVLAVVVGAAVNGAVVTLGAGLVPLPEGLPPGANMNTPEGIRAAVPHLAPLHFLFPWLAHAIGTLAGAIIAARWTSERMRTIAAYAIGLLFFSGGRWMATQIPDPIWFVVLDLSLAYLPMAWLALRLVKR
jgi:hypothetical protein